MNLLPSVIFFCLTLRFNLNYARCQGPDVNNSNYVYFDQNQVCFAVYDFPSSKKEGDIFYISWRIESGTLNMTVVAKNYGYMAIGFAPNRRAFGMENSDAIIGIMDGDESKAIARKLPASIPSPIYSNTNFPEKPDTYLEDCSFEVKGEFQTLKFSRKLTTTNSEDIQINDGFQNLIFAKHSFYDMKFYHSNRGLLRLDLHSGKNIEVDETVIVMYDGISTFYVCVAIICFFGILVLQLCPTGCCGHLLLHQKLGLPPKKDSFCANKIVRKLTLGFCSSMMSMTWGESIATIIYVAGCLVLSCILLLVQTLDRYPGSDSYLCKSTGWMMMLCLMMNLLPVTKNSIWIYIFGIAYNRAIRYHRILGRISLISATTHLTCVLIVYADLNVLTQVENKGQHDGAFGFCTYIILCLMGLVSIFRRKYWNIFTYTHRLWLPMVILQMIHVNTTLNYVSILFPVSLLIVDKCIAWFYTLTKHRVTVVRLNPLHQVTMLEMKLQNNKNLNFKAGNYCFINIPQISLFEWHPFSISSQPGLASNTFTFHIKSCGGSGFTRKLYDWAETERQDRLGSDEYVSCTKQKSVLETTALNTVYIDGPYGTLTVNLEAYKTIIMCGAGVGVTPFASILSDVHSKRNSVYMKTRKVSLIWVIRNSEYITWFSHLFDKVRDENDPDEDAPRTGGYRFEIRIYNTNKTGEPQHPLGDWDEEEVMGDAMIGAIVGQVGEKKNELSILTKVQNEQERGLKEKSGRPDFRELFLEITGGTDKTHEVAVLACGPHDQVSNAEYEATRLGFHFHKESFHL